MHIHNQVKVLTCGMIVFFLNKLYINNDLCAVSLYASCLVHLDPAFNYYENIKMCQLNNDIDILLYCVYYLYLGDS